MLVPIGNMGGIDVEVVSISIRGVHGFLSGGEATTERNYEVR